ncbi:MAG TPA: indole-3-glycerol phosphate synthase, partial [Chloroflexota bacterium]
EVERALAAGARLVGINNRDLHSFAVDLAVTERLRPLVPAEVTVVGESGVQGAAEVARLRAAGVQAILVGEALMRAGLDGVPAKLADLRGAP